MSFINTYQSPVFHPVTESDPGPVDVYFNLPVPERLETARVRLEPWNPSIHTKIFYDQYRNSPGLGEYLPFDWPTYPSFLTFIQYRMLSDAKALPLAIIDRTKGPNLDESIAGMIGFVNSAPHNLSIEIAPVVILPRAQRTFVSSNAIGLMLKYALDLSKNGGLGLRRVVWTANPNNKASVRAAQRMGFTIEGVSRWTWVLPVGKDGGNSPVDGQRGEGQGRNSTVLSLCWDDWEGGVKEQVEQMMERVV